MQKMRGRVEEWRSGGVEVEMRKVAPKINSVSLMETTMDRTQIKSTYTGNLCTINFVMGAGNQSIRLQLS
jgi:hypothetical protein